ncbi:MAG: hypothetical protein GX819_04065, partial [Clostridiaceae bacterium]|nr:hypothetical protein [Clostridiaceae bacterium]
MEQYKEKNVKEGSKPSLSQTIRIQETFLNHCRREKINVVIQLFDQT